RTALASNTEPAIEVLPASSSSPTTTIKNHPIDCLLPEKHSIRDRIIESDTFSLSKSESTLTRDISTHRDPAAGRTVFVETSTGRSQLNPPLMNAAGPPQAYQQQQPAGYQYPQGQGSNGLGGPQSPPPPPPPTGPSATNQPPKAKRVYAANQAQAYYGADGGAANNFFTPGQAQPNQAFQQQQQPSYDQQHSQQPYPQPQSQYASSPNNNNQPSAYMASDPVGDLSQQFQGMGMGQKGYSFSTTNLVGMVPNPQLVNAPPPAIRLPPGVRTSNTTISKLKEDANIIIQPMMNKK
ncbi:hypothetical protein H4Q26_010088, partial [Puccinia striiformis f. sp. tritici PST-130]